MKSIESIIWNWTVRKGVFAIIIIVGSLAVVNGQMAGSRGGVQSGHFEGQQHLENTAFTPGITDEQVTEYITVKGSVELRVKPDQIRMVLGITKSAKTSAECEAAVFAKIDELKKAFVELGIPETDIVDDFIAILPRYRYDIENAQGKTVAVEKLDGYNMQSNLHIKVNSELQANAVSRAAFQLDVSNVIGVDYWSKELDAIKLKAFEQATAKAKSKAEFLLGETMSDSPRPINVKENTRVIMPDKLYQSFTNSHDSQFSQSRNYYRQDIPTIQTFRPKNTYYQGHFEDGDQSPTEISMGPEIYVVSHVTLFYASPVAKEYRSLEAQAKD